MTDFLIVGSGFYGSVLAERIANVLKKKVLVIDQRNHIGGNCYSEIDKKTGIEHHVYGTHIFHTSSVNIWNYINKFTKQIVEIQKTQNGYVRPIIWRGSEMMAISAQKNKINVAIATWEWGSYFDPKLKLEGIRLNISSWRRPSPESIPWDTKASGLYMICTLSKHEAEAKGYVDSLMLDHEGNVAEATGANIFFKNSEGELHTPTPDSFLDGITRRCIIEIAKSKGIKVIERKIKPEEMSNFVGCFLTGTAAEVTPVACIDKYNFKVCDVITDLADSYQGLVRKKKNAA